MDLLRVIRPFLLFLGAAFILTLIVHGRNELQAVLSRVDWGLCAGSLALALVSNFVSVLAFNGFLAKHGQGVDAGMAARMLMYGQVAKYIPGKIWGLVYQAAHFKGALPAIKVVTLTNIELMLVGMVANAAVAVGLLSYFSYPLLTGVCFVTGLVMSMYLYAFSGYGAVLRWLQRLFPGIGDGGGMVYSPKGMAQVAGYYFSIWLFYLSGAFLMIAATTTLSFQQTAVTIAVMNIAWILSAVVFVFPAGIGVREVVFVWLSYQTETGVSLELIAVIAVLFRFWQVALDILGAAIVWLGTLVRRRKDFRRSGELN